MFHFEDWPDNGFPRDNNKLLQLVHRIEDCKQKGDRQPPIVVMCRFFSYIFHKKYMTTYYFYL